MYTTVFPDTIEVSENDKDREYRYVTLPNDLSVLLISDPATEKAAACCDVRVGSFQDPDDFPGLAHFLEHMLFMGTEKYPGENQYSHFLNDHGGGSNAYTSSENTVYFFDVSSDHFQEALDIFAAFFTCPLFAKDSVEREMNAVDSENSKNLQSDAWRNMQLLKHFASKTHPFNKFSTGNLDTLKISSEKTGKDARTACMEFHEKFYSANTMKVCLYGKEDLDTLQKWAETCFSAVRNKKLPAIPYVPPSPFTAKDCGKVIQVVPIKDTKEVDIYWPIESTQHLYKSKPTRYLAHLLGHESKGSILAKLKEEGLANELYSYCSEDYAAFGMMEVCIKLTDEGLARVNEVVACIFAYLHILTAQGAQEWVSKELRDTADMAFRFKSKVQPQSYVVSRANDMHLVPPEHAVSGSDLQYEDNHLQGTEICHQMTPDNCIIFVRARKFAETVPEADFQEEPWYKTQFTEIPFTNAQKEMWDKAYKGEVDIWSQALHLPKKNDLLPTNYSLRCPAGKATDEEKHAEKHPHVTRIVKRPPRAAGDVPTTKLISWFRPDLKWAVPKVSLQVTLKTPETNGSPRGVALSDMVVEVVKELLIDYSYYADCAKLSFRLYTVSTGFGLDVEGYSHKLPLLVTKICETMAKLVEGTMEERLNLVSQDVFERVKALKMENYANLVFQQPYMQVITGTSICMTDVRWHYLEKKRALAKCTREDLMSFTQACMSSMSAETFVYGNASADEADQISQLIVETLGLTEGIADSEVLQRRVVKLPCNSDYVYRQSFEFTNPEEVNSAIENSYFVDFDGLSDASHALITEKSSGYLAPVIASITKASKGGQNKRQELATAKRELSLRASALAKLLMHVMSEPAFDQLRTKEQLGYVVFAGETAHQFRLALRVIVQSSHKGASYLDERIELFLKQFKTEILETKLSKEDGGYVDNINAVVEELLEKPKNIFREGYDQGAEISLGRYDFGRKEAIAERVKQITLSDLQCFFMLFAGVDDNNARRKLSSQFYGKDTTIPNAVEVEEKNVVVIDTPTKFRASMPLEAVEEVNSPEPHVR